MNSPLNYIDPNGEEPISIGVLIAIGAVVCGTVNVAIHWNQLKSPWDYFAAFTIGAAAGALGVWSGGAAFVAAGGGAAGAGGAWAGIMGGMAGYAASTPVQNIGNHLYFGDPLMTPEQYAQGLLISGALGGSMQGIQAAMNGRNFFTGELLTSKVTPMTSLQVPTAPKAEIKAEALKPKLQTIENTAPTKQVLPPQSQPQPVTGLANPAAKTEYQQLVDKAKQLYPNKTGIQQHHITPKYIGGTQNGPLAPLDAAYHQVITNEFRTLQPYGLGPLNEMQRLQLMQQVYSKYPLPPGYTY